MGRSPSCRALPLIGVLLLGSWSVSHSLGPVGDLKQCDASASEGQQSFFFLMQDAATPKPLVGVDNAGHTYSFVKERSPLCTVLPCI